MRWIANIVYHRIFLLKTLKGRRRPGFGLSRIGEGVMGRALNKKLDNAKGDRSFEMFMAMIIAISAYNVWHYSAW